MNNPNVLLVDEPASALDQERGASITVLILRLTRTRHSTLLVTLDLVHLPRMHAVVHMVDGRPRDQRAAAALTSPPLPHQPRGEHVRQRQLMGPRWSNSPALRSSYGYPVVFDDAGPEDLYARTMPVTRSRTTAERTISRGGPDGAVVLVAAP